MPSLGFDIGGTNLRGLRLDRDGSTSSLLQEEHSGDPEEIIGTVTRMARELIQESSSEVKKAGVGCAGHVTPSGIVKTSPNLPSFKNFSLKDVLEERLQMQVVIENDANCSAWAEYRIGAAIGKSNILVVSFGTGIGAGLILNDSIYKGSYGLAGEVGHITVEIDGRPCPCGNKGCWEQYSSGAELNRLIQGNEKNPNQQFAEILFEFSQKVSVGLQNLSHILDPEIIVLSGGITAIGNPLLQSVRKAFFEQKGHRDNKQLTQIDLGKFGNEAGAIGAALFASEI